jgi:UDPglucose--hexose-1-phosphate uridylyltransferase
MSELRHDRISGAWVIIAPERRNRPQRRTETTYALQSRSSFDPGCPFCPGNEAMLPSILEDVPAESAPDWKVRVVPNKYPALHPDAVAAPSDRYGDMIMPGYGFHDIVIESPRHNADLAAMSDGEIEAVLATYHRRFVWLSEQERIQRVILFRNYGPTGGASLVHPHAQLVAVAMTPPDLASCATVARSWHERHGRCVLCDDLELERADGRRMVEEGEFFMAIVPFAATRQFEVWLVPKRHQASFAETERDELGEMGLLLRSVLCRLKCVLGDPPCNFVVDSAGPAEAGRPYLHWRLRIAPGLVTPGGFELATGMSINPSSPEDDARALRDAEGNAPRP